MYACQKVQVSSSLCRPKANFRYPQGQQRAAALQGFINNIQNTILTVYEVESQKISVQQCDEITIVF